MTFMISNGRKMMRRKMMRRKMMKQKIKICKYTRIAAIEYPVPAFQTYAFHYAAGSHTPSAKKQR